MKNENMGAEDLHLESDNTLLDKAEYIAKSTLIDDKFAFLLYYDANQKEFLLSVLQTIEAVVERDDEERHVVFAMLNMAQLAFIKGLGCLTKVRTNERSNPFPEEELAKFKSDQNGEQVGETNAEEQGSIPVAEDPVTLEATTKVEATTVQAQVTMGIATEDEISKDGIADVSAEVLATGPSVRCSSNTSMAAALEISDDSGTSGNIAYPGAEQWFKFTATKSCQYTIYTTGNLDTIGTLYDDDKNLICEVNDYAPCGKINFRIIRNLTAGKTYYVRVRVDGDDTDTYELVVTKNVLANYVTINKSTITLEKDVLYELPITPNYTYKGYKGARRIPGLSVSLNPSNTTNQTIWWWESSGGILKRSWGWDDDGDRYIHVTATGIGTAKLYAQDWDEDGKRDECNVNADNMLIYRTRNRERLGFYDSSNNNDTNPITAEDLTYGSKSTQTMITNGTRIAMSDLNNYNSISQRVTIIKNFFNSQINYDETFMGILSEMVDHFVDGTGTDYSNEALTSAVQSHSRTTSYVNSVVTLVKNYISKNKTAIGNLAYDENLWTQPVKRASHPLVSAMNTAISNGAKELYLPSYGYNNGVPGLTLALHGFYGNKIKLKNFQNTGSTYSGTLEFTFYDHFGLDTPDLTDVKFGNLTAGTFPGFKQWFILQHWSELEGAVQPKPFVTNVSFSVPISGTYE